MSIIRPRQTLSKRLSVVNSFVNYFDRLHDSDRQEYLASERDKYSDMSVFFKDAWQYAGTSDLLQWGWHIDAICEHLTACHYFQIKYLIINIPPRMSKSTSVGVIFPAWEWTINPTSRFLYASYSLELSRRDNLNMQQLIKSPWYQERWGDDFFFTIANKGKTHNNRGGIRISSSVGGTNTGEGGHFIIADDPNNVGEVHSTVIREGVLRWWDQVMTSRQNNMFRSCRIIIQQRSHEEDLTGHILSKELPDVVFLNLPMEYEKKRHCVTEWVSNEGESKRWEDPRSLEGEILAPNMFPKKKIEELKVNLGSYGYSGQYQQSPSPAEGGLFKREWFNIWDKQHLPDCEFVIQCWDTALSTEPTAAYSACTTWGVFKDERDIPQMILLDVFYDRLEWPELRKMMIRLAKNYHDVIMDSPLTYRDAPDVVVIEAKANGLSLIQSLRRAGIDCQGYTPPKTQRWGNVDLKTSQGKIQRARLISPLVENGRVWLPAKPPSFTNLYIFADKFREACANFPNNIEATRDLVDTFSQAVEWLHRHNWVYGSDEVQPPLYDEYSEDDNRFKPKYEG